MKKIFFLMLLMTACCLIGQAQTATTAKKATLMGPGSQIVDVKTGQVIRTTNPAPTKDLTNIQAPVTNSINGGSATFSKNTGSQGKAAPNQFEVPARMPIDVPEAKAAPAQVGKSAGQGVLAPNATLENTLQSNRPEANDGPAQVGKSVGQGVLAPNTTLENTIQSNRPAPTANPTNAKNVSQGSLISTPTLNKPNKVQPYSNVAKPMVSPNPNINAPVYPNARKKGQK